MNAKISLIKCPNYNWQLVQDSVKRAVDLIGGLSSFIKPQTKVLLKPNLLMAKEPEAGITTHPEVVRAVVSCLRDINCKIFLGDGPSVWGNQIENVDEVYERTGMKRVCAQEGITLVKFDKRRMRKKFPLTTWLDDCEYVVNLPKFKTHDLTILTGAIKNLFGLITGTYKTELHKNYFAANDFAKMLVDIYEEVRPSLTIIDGIVAMEGDGPATSGKLRNTGLLLASSDCVAVDSILALIMGLEPQDIPTNKEAAQRGLGVADIEHISILGEKLEDVIQEEPFQLPTTSMVRKIPRPVINLAKKLIKYYPCVDQDNCIRCGICIKACPNQAISIKNNCLSFNYSQCISCFCCQEVCPGSAIKVKKSLLAKMVGL